jgi:hypothetical protein
VANYLYNPAEQLLADEPEALRAGAPQGRLAHELFETFFPVAQERYKDILQIVMPARPEDIEED